MNKGDIIKEAKAAILAYQQGPGPETARRLVGDLDREGDSIFGPILINAAYLFANKHLANNFSPGGGLDPKRLGRIHEWAPPESLGHFDKRIIDRSKFEELKIDMSIRLLEALRGCRVEEIKDPFSWAKTVLHNFGCDLANRDKAESKGVQIKRPAQRTARPGDEGQPARDILENAKADDCWGHDGPRTEISELPLLRLEELYQQAFSREFRTALETSVGFVAHYFRAAKPKLYRKDYPAAKSALDSLMRLSKQIEAIERKADKEVGNRMTINIEVDRKFAYDYWEKREELEAMTRSYKLRYEKPEATDAGFRIHVAPDIYITEKRPEPVVAQSIWMLNVSPPRMLYDIWIESDEVKRRKNGAQNCRYKLALIFWYQKRKAAGTEREILFDRLRGDSDLENLRKYQYRELRKGKHRASYRWLVKAIYRRCFIDKWNYSMPLIEYEKL